MRRKSILLLLISYSMLIPPKAARSADTRLTVQVIDMDSGMPVDRGHVYVMMPLSRTRDQDALREFLDLKFEGLPNRGDNRAGKPRRSGSADILLTRLGAGRHELRGLMPGDYYLTVFVDGYGYELRRIKIGTGDEKLEVRLGRSVALRGWIRDEQGRSLEGAEVTAVWADESVVGLLGDLPVISGGLTPTATTLSSGEFVLDTHIIPNKPFVIQVCYPGLLPYRSALFTGPPGKLLEVELTVPDHQGLDFSGSVVDEEGAPLEGATVRLSRLRTEEGLTGRILDALSTPGLERSSHQRAVTDSNGFFHFRNLYEGNYRITARKSGFKGIAHRHRLEASSNQLRIRLLKK